MEGGPKVCSSCKSTDIISDGNISGTYCGNCGVLQQSALEEIFNSLEEKPGSYDGLDFRYDDEKRFSRNYQAFIARATAITNVVGLPASVIEEIKPLAQRLWTHNMFKHHSDVNAKIAACILCITRLKPELSLIKPNQIARACQVNIGKVKRCYTMCKKLFDLPKTPTFSFRDYIEKLAMYVSQENYQKLVEFSLNLEAVVMIERYGGNPILICIALLYYAAKDFRIRFSVPKLSLHFGVDSTMVYVRTKLIKTRLLKYSERIPWRPPNLKLKTIYMYIPEILRYFKEFGNEEDHDNEYLDMESRVDVAMEEMKIERTGKSRRETSSNEPMIIVTKELLRKGCTKAELCKETLASLSRRYLDMTSQDIATDEIDDEEDISDSEIDGFLKTQEEIEEAEKLQLQNISENKF